MSRDKQVEEMAKQLYGNFGLTMPTARNVATYLTEKKGYRKSTDLAEEIFAEIETSLVIGGFVNGEKYIAIREDDYNHYKKKYTEGGE